MPYAVGSVLCSFCCNMFWPLQAREAARGSEKRICSEKLGCMGRSRFHWPTSFYAVITTWCFTLLIWVWRVFCPPSSSLGFREPSHTKACKSGCQHFYLKNSRSFLNSSLTTQHCAKCRQFFVEVSLIGSLACELSVPTFFFLIYQLPSWQKWLALSFLELSLKYWSIDWLIHSFTHSITIQWLATVQACHCRRECMSNGI